jgi:hypothetical protein
MSDSPLLLIDIDGLRFDAIQTALEKNLVPNIARLLGGDTQGACRPMISTFPSITFTAQASLFTGVTPSQHGILGNQFFDRFGDLKGKPRFFAFDVGDLLDFDDAVLVFTHGLASDCLQAPTIYEILGPRGFTSAVAGHMYARGADEWIKPSVIDLARLTKGGSLLGMEPPDYDATLLEKTTDYLKDNGLPDVLTYYLKGLDDVSHHQGIESQLPYLVEEIDPHLGRLWETIQTLFPEKSKNMTVLMFADHGQIDVTPDEKHSIRIAFPYQNEMAHLFEALGLDMQDYPGEGPACGAVVAMNGGMAQVYLRSQEGDWDKPPSFERDILPVARAFWGANDAGQHAPELQDAIDSIFVRDTERDGWDAPYQAFTSQGKTIPLDEFYAKRPSKDVVNPVQRMHELACKFSGDILLISNYTGGYYFSPVIKGVHGGLHPEDSTAFLAIGRPITSDSWKEHRNEIFSGLADEKGYIDLCDVSKAVYQLLDR